MTRHLPFALFFVQSRGFQIAEIDAYAYGISLASNIEREGNMFYKKTSLFLLGLLLSSLAAHGLVTRSLTVDRWARSWTQQSTCQNRGSLKACR